jgi:SAM-dependent methyltransferase
MGRPVPLRDPRTALGSRGAAGAPWLEGTAPRAHEDDARSWAGGVVTARHPARFTSSIMPVLADAVTGYDRVLDPFAGTGRIHVLANFTVGVELEPEWAAMHPDTIVGDATTLPFGDASFDAVATSPTYGNRMADHHSASDPSRRTSYTHNLGRRLHPNNSGAMHWGEPYRQLHVAAWREVERVLRPGGRFVLNVKDHLKAGRRQPVTAWHVGVVLGLGFELYACVPVAVSGRRYGANRERIPYEVVLTFDKPTR